VDGTVLALALALDDDDAPPPQDPPPRSVLRFIQAPLHPGLAATPRALLHALDALGPVAGGASGLDHDDAPPRRDPPQALRAPAPSASQDAPLPSLADYKGSTSGNGARALHEEEMEGKGAFVARDE
jgi:hypothetical protein